MKAKVRLVFKLGLVLLVLALTAGAGQAQEPPPPEREAGMEPQSADAYIFPTMSYQGSLTESGTPVDGIRSMTFRLFNVSSGGTAIWTQGPQNVVVRDGVFTANLGGASHFPMNKMNQNLWLEIEVEGTVLPRQRLRGAPYALSLAPGADVSGQIDGGESMFMVKNNGTGIGLLGMAGTNHGVHAISNGAGADGSALYAHSIAGTGEALWAHNDARNSINPVLRVNNDGWGDLFRGYGGDGGNDEFRIANSGKVMTRANSFVFVPGNAFVKWRSFDTTRWYITINGGASIYRGAAAGEKLIYYPITMPSVLYGQAVQIKNIRIYYKCENGANNYIDATRMYLQTDADSTDVFFEDYTDHISESATNYTILVDETLSNDQGILGLYLTLNFVNDTEWIKIGGVRIELDHHPLY